MINNEYCMSIKNKREFIQCTHKRKNNSDFCGIHKRSKNVTRIDAINIKDINDNNKIDIIRETNIPFALTSHKLLKRSCKYYNINCKGMKKNEMYIKLMIHLEQLRVYENNVHYIIKIQTILRRYLIKRVYNCVNNENLLDFESLFLVPLYYFISINENKMDYGFDIRCLFKLRMNNKLKNPYTGQDFSNNSINKINNRINILLKNEVPLVLIKDKLSPEKEFVLWVESIFQNIDLLDNYTDAKWFFDLSLQQLKMLYKTCEDIWNYRCQFTLEQKQKIVSNGILFSENMQTVFNTNNERWLQNIILEDFEKMITQGVDISERKLGAMLILTALVEVSVDAANAYPYLVQSVNMN